MNKTDLLFQMMEQPQAYTEQQWQEILSDEECCELYTLMAKTQSAFDVQKEIDDKTIDAEWKRLTVSTNRKWFRVAAMFIGVLLISGIAIAAIYMIQSRSVEPTRTEAEANSSLFTPHSSLQEPVRFSNASLDSVLSVVSHHYHHSVCFQNDTLRQLRFTIAWDSIQPLATFLENVNEFEGLQLIDARDTIFVNVEKEVQP